MLQNRLSNIYKIASLLILISITYPIGFAQTRHRKLNNRNKKVSVKKKVLVKDDETVQESHRVSNIDGKLISAEKAMEILASSDVKIEQIYKDGKPIAAKLVKNELIGTLSADFSFKTINNKTINLTQQQEKLTVLNFWYVGCEPCLIEIPIFNKLVEKYKDNKNIEFFAVTFVASEDVNGISNLKSFLEKNKFDFQISIASKSVLDAFKIRAYPQTIVLDKEGKIIFWRMIVNENAQSLDKFIESELKN